MQILVLDPRKIGQLVYLFPRDYISIKEEKQLREKQLNIADMLDLIRVLKQETRPRKNHPNPEDIIQCWLELEEKIKESF